MSTHGRRKQIAIVGAGLVGTVLAMFLARQGHAVIIYESRADPRRAPPRHGRSINLTIAERGWKTLRELEIDQDIRRLAIPLRGRRIHAETGGAHFQPYTEKGESIYSISRVALNVALLELTTTWPNISILFNHRCVGVNFDRRKLLFDCSETDNQSSPDSSPNSGAASIRPGGYTLTEVDAEIVFAADGGYSGVRRTLLRRPDFHFYQKYSPLQYKELTIPAPGEGWPLENNVLHLWPRGDHLMVAFPNPDRSMTCSLFLRAQGERSFENINTPEDLADLFEHSWRDLLPLLPDIVHDYFARPPASLMTTRCSPWVYGGWLAMIGDAAHTMVPFLGQGANAGLEDCSVLARCLRTRSNWDTALAEYEEQRRSNCNVVTELAEHHYLELAERARDPRFLVEKALEQKIFRLAPDRYVPLYNMVSFLDTPYVEIDRRHKRQQGLLAELMKMPRIDQIWDTPDVEREVHRLLDRLPQA